MQKLKLIASDIDGTLLQNGQTEISPEMFYLIEKMHQEGILFCAASGRQYSSLKRLFAPVADKIAYVCENGAAIFKDDILLAKTPLPQQAAQQLVQDILAQPDCEVLISGANTSYLLPKRTDYVEHIQFFLGNHIAQINTVEEIPEEILKISAYCYGGATACVPALSPQWASVFNIAVAGACWLDFTIAHKGAALQQLGALLSILPNEMAAFGDNFNDLEMLRYAQHSYAMCSAVPEVCKAAKHTVSRVEDAVSSLLNIF
ncbi:MAG: HAD-IIB family hydrolase [Oscillospiraceae bacterium]|nr:HAD-IIB family hydrolase [Oscillospiraceae bacterium]